MYQTRDRPGAGNAGAIASSSTTLEPAKATPDNALFQEFAKSADVANQPKVRQGLAGHGVPIDMLYHGVYAAIRDGAVPHIKIGRRIVIPRAAFDRRFETAGAGEAA